MYILTNILLRWNALEQSRMLFYTFIGQLSRHVSLSRCTKYPLRHFKCFLMQIMEHYSGTSAGYIQATAAAQKFVVISGDLFSMDQVVVVESDHCYNQCDTLNSEHYYCMWANVT